MQLVLPCTSRHQNIPWFSFLCLLSGALSLVLYFRVQTGTKTNLFLVVYVYGVVLSVATCTFVYKQAPKQTYLTGGLVVYVFWGGMFSRNLYFRVQNLFYRGLVVYVYWEGKVLLVASCTPEYKQAPYKREKNTYQSIDSR